MFRMSSWAGLHTGFYSPAGCRRHLLHLVNGGELSGRAEGSSLIFASYSQVVSLSTEEFGGFQWFVDGT